MLKRITVRSIRVTALPLS